MRCDDLFIRKLHHGVTGTSNTTNIVGLIVSEGLATYEEFLDIALKLVKCKYLYPLGTLLIKELFTWILSIDNEDVRNDKFNKLREIYLNILDDVSRQHYRKIHEDFVQAVRDIGIPVALIYELVREPFKLKPLDEFIKEKSQEIIRDMFGLDDAK